MVLAVHDQGPGVPSDQRERIFEPYAQLDGPTAQPSAAWDWASTSLGGWPAPAAASCEQPTHQVAVGPALSCAYPRSHQPAMNDRGWSSANHEGRR